MVDTLTTAEPGDSSIADASPAQGAPASEQLTLVERVAAQLGTNTPAEPEESIGEETPATPAEAGTTTPPPPPGSSERQVENWAQANAKISTLQQTVEQLKPMADRMAAIEPFQTEVNQFLQLSELVDVDPDVHGREFERLVYTMNPALWDAMVRRAGTVYAADLGLTQPQQPVAQPQPVVERAPYQQPVPQPQTPLQVPEFTAEELEDRRAVYGDEEVARLQALTEAARVARSSQAQLRELSARVTEIQNQAEVEKVMEANNRHDAQFSEEISNQLGALVPRYITTAEGKQDWNPEFVALWKYFDTAYDNDELARTSREASRTAYRNQMKGAQPKLTAAVRSHIGAVIARDIAPLIAARQNAQLTQTEQARAAEKIPPSPPSGNGAAPPAPGQAGMSLVDRVALVKANARQG